MTDARAMYSNLAYDPLKDVDQIGEIADVPLMLVGSKSMPANGLKELIPYLRSRQEKT